MSRAQENGKNIGAVLREEKRIAALYRTIVAGPSGQRKDLYIATVRLPDGDGLLEEYTEYDLAIIREARIVGYANKTHEGWEIVGDFESFGLKWIGTSESLALGCDVLVHGEHAATGRHDFRRISQSAWKPNPHFTTWLRETHG